VRVARFNCQQDVGRAAVAANELKLRASIGVERGWEQNRGGAAARSTDSVLFRANVLEGSDAAFRQRNAGIDVRHDASDIGHFANVELGTGIRQAVER